METSSINSSTLEDLKKQLVEQIVSSPSNLHIIDKAYIKELLLSKKCLYKYLPLEHALSTLENHSFWISNPVMWPDPFESFFIKAKYMDHGVEKPYPYENKTFCTCFTQNVSSEAQWKAYSNNEICIELRVRPWGLILALLEYAEKYPEDQIFVGRVDYKYELEIAKHNLVSEIPIKKTGGVKMQYSSDDMWARMFLLKRKAFEYEQELRVIIFKKVTPANPNGISLDYSINNNEMIKSIWVSPSTKERTYNAIKTILESQKYGMAPQGAASRVFQSGLYKKITEPITLTF